MSPPQHPPVADAGPDQTASPGMVVALDGTASSDPDGDAVAAAARFLKRNAAAAVALYFLNGLLFVAVLALYALAAPGAGPAGPMMWAGVAVSQLYLAARVWVRLVFLASEVSLFQNRLAAAGYIAVPLAPRAEPPIVEQLVSEIRQ